jgi:hypothetical protein
LDFPRVRRFVRFDLLSRRAAAIAWILGLASFLVNMAAAVHVVPEAAVRNVVPHRGGTIFWGLFSLLCVPAIAAILLRSRRAPWAERRKVARFALALAAGLSPLFVLGLLRTLVPDVDRWLRSADLSDRLWLDRIVLGSLAATPVLTAWAVIVDRPFGSRPRVQSVCWPWRLAMAPVAVAAAVVIALQMRDAATGPKLAASYAWFAVGSAAAAAMALLLRARVLGAMERRHFGRGADLHNRLTAALDRLRTARGDREIAAVLRREFHRGIGASSVRILIAERAGWFRDAVGTTERLRPEAGLAAVLREAGQPLDLSSGGALFPLLSGGDREWVVKTGAELALSMNRRDGELAAIVLLGGKRAGEVFDRLDRWFVAALCSAAAAAWHEGAEDAFALAPRARRGGARQSRAGEAAYECPRCGRVSGRRPLRCCTIDETSLAALPRRLAGKFVVQRRIGSGGMGVVYLARDLTLGRYVALKTLPEISPDGAARLRGEARAMASLSHESLATIYGLEIWQRTPVLVLEYFRHGTLAGRLASGPLPCAAVMSAGIHLVRGVAMLHGCGLLHRDLKPSNIAFTATGATKILDFGLIGLLEGGSGSHHRSRIVDAANAERAGTLAYLPPEAFQRGRVSQHFDLWGVAVVLLEAAIGVNPFAANTRAATVERILDPGRDEILAHAGIAAPGLAGFFERALACAQDARFQSAAEMLVALQHIDKAASASRPTSSSSLP